MSNEIRIRTNLLDPYTASSLMQKAIRRNEPDLACWAARSLYRHRGRGIWRRLAIIAFEDVGVGNLDLVAEIVSVAARRQNHQTEDDCLPSIERFCDELARATKNRASDHLCCAAEAFLARNQGCDDAILEMAQVVAMAADPDLPLVERAAAILSPDPFGKMPQPAAVVARIHAVAPFLPEYAASLFEPSDTAFRLVKHHFVLLLPLLAASYWEERALRSVIENALPESEMISGVPSYTFDKHTWLGKKAISLFADRNSEVRQVLQSYAVADRAAPIAQMAVFHVDSAPVERELRWSTSPALERLGLEADMTKVGCPVAAISAVIDAVGANLPHLNAIRRELREGGTN